MDITSQLRSKRYISVETYRRDGRAVQTPVWFYVDEGAIYVVTRSKTGKAKRLKNNPKVRIAECTMGGKVTGPWISGTATILDRERTAVAVKMRDKKYGMRARLAKFLTGGKGEFFALAITLDQEIP